MSTDIDSVARQKIAALEERVGELESLVYKVANMALDHGEQIERQNDGPSWTITDEAAAKFGVPGGRYVLVPR
jgi:hypothetical protein